MKFYYLLLCFTILYYSCSDNLKTARKTFGEEKNASRQALHLVSVDPAFKIIEDNSLANRRFIFINKIETELENPDFLRKSILIDKTKQHITIEEDTYKNPNIKKYLIVTHDYLSNFSNIELQDINEYVSNNASIKIDTRQADSILKSWKIKTNPFKDEF